MVLSYVDLLIQRLRENSGKPQDLMALFNWTTFDLIGDLAFGESFDCLKHQRYHPWVQTLLEGINGGLAVSAAERYGLGGLLVSLIPQSMKEPFDLMFALTKDKVARRMERGTERPDFMSHWLRHNMNEQAMSQPEMEENALSLIVAGSETTASLLAAASYFLMRNPRILDRVTEEVRTAFSTEQEINFTSINQLHYLTAVLKETMRIYPPAPSGTPRKTILPGGDHIDGHWVPQHTSLAIFQWACNHSALNFHKPDKFHPDRWLENSPTEFANDSKEAMQPFGLGPRNCIGKSLAWVEIRIIMARLLWGFDIELERDSWDWVDQKIYLIWAKKPLMAWLKPVKRV